ncbi:hypothetical protein AGDE_14619 [Angomonas deanei]|nr:hypothetical protein AGDE_14619 [Angomonas deanei]|eukprot:EPY20539.1 hypothetical protein AGDE_14619 [Angomonas deanei]
MGMKAPPVHVGNLLIGNFYELNPPVWNTAPVGNAEYAVSSIQNDQPNTGDSFVIYGIFDASQTYTVQFYNLQSPMVDGSPGLPTCTGVVATSSSLTCTVKSEIGMMGMYRFLVTDSTGWILPGSTTVNAIAINPTNPTVSSATFSSNVLTITGENLQLRRPPAGVTKWKHLST